MSLNLWTINNIPLFHLLVLVGVVCTLAVPAFIVAADAGAIGGFAIRIKENG